MAKFKNWPFTSNLAIRLFWPFVGPDRSQDYRAKILSENSKDTLEIPLQLRKRARIGGLRFITSFYINFVQP